MRVDVTPVESSAPLEETFQRMQIGELTALPLLEADRLVGLITMENIAEFLMVSSALEGAPVLPDEDESGEPLPTAAVRPAKRGRRAWHPRRSEQF
jgi:predicted transcriptional regulator